MKIYRKLWVTRIVFKNFHIRIYHFRDGYKSIRFFKHSDQVFSENEKKIRNQIESKFPLSYEEAEIEI